jgi:hypothetical protein
MHIELGLNNPCTAPQLAYYFLVHTGSAIEKRLVGVEQHLRVEFVGDGLV